MIKVSEYNLVNPAHVTQIVRNGECLTLYFTQVIGKNQLQEDFLFETKEEAIKIFEEFQKCGS